MTNRREFLQTAAALSAAPLAGRAAFASGRESIELGAVVVDARHLAARSFGARAGALGAPLRMIEGDITDLWQSELRLRWMASPAAIAGLTERPALFLLEQLGWEHGLRVVFEAEHQPEGQNRAAHRVIRTADPRLANDLDAAGGRWPDVLADALIGRVQTRARNAGPTSAGLAAHLGEQTKLHSWIIAPRAAAQA